MRGFLVLVVLAVLSIAALLIVRRVMSQRVRNRENEIEYGPVQPILRRGALVIAPLIVILFVMIASVRTVPVGHALVIFNTITRSFDVAQQGVTFVWPFITSTAEYDLRRQEYTMTKTSGEGRKSQWDDSLWSPTKEGLQIGVDITIWHHIDPQRVAQIHQTIGADYEEKIIRPAARSVIRLVISEYAVAEVYSEKRATIQEEINSKIKRIVEKDGFVIDEVVLRDVHFSEQFGKAIEAKQIAQQSAEQMRYVLEKEQREAERKVIEAQGRAKAIETVNAALRENPNYVKYLYVDKLSDNVQVIISDQDTIMDLKGVLDRSR
jgi:regulator of protease activity HflC (stomatin/prohibitin superfamily)